MLKLPMDRERKPCPSLMVMESSQPIPRCILHSLFLVQLLCSETDRLEVAMRRGVCELASLHDIKVTGVLRATWRLNSAWWIRRVLTRINFSRGNDVDEGEV